MAGFRRIILGVLFAISTTVSHAGCLTFFRSLFSGQKRGHVHSLLQTYGRAWETQDTDLIASIFTPDATYNDPHEPLNQGLAAIRKYWDKKVVMEQKNIRFILLNFWIDKKDPSTVIAEWEAHFDDLVNQKHIHMFEVAIFRLKDGKFTSLREYYKTTKSQISI